MVQFNASNIFEYKKNNVSPILLTTQNNIDGNGEARDFVRNGILSLFDGQANIPNKTHSNFNGKIDTNEFKQVSKIEYLKYTYEMKKYLKEGGNDFSKINIPSYEELQKLIEEGEISGKKVSQKTEENPLSSEWLVVDPESPQKYDDNTILNIISSNKSKKSKMTDAELLKMITNAANKHNLDRKLLTELIRQESAFNPDAGSNKGAMGLTQLLGSTAKDMGLKQKDYFNPQENINAGAKYLKQLLVKYGGDVKMALAAYNGGMGNVAKADDIPAFAETQHYVKVISERYLTKA